MSDFINTIDQLGDDVVFTSIVERTITEFKDNVLTSVVSYCFTNCNELTILDLPNVTNFGTYSCQTCTSLKSVNLPNVTSLGASIFDGCTSLEIIVLSNLNTMTGNSIFNNCSKLSMIDFPKLTNIKYAAFKKCSKLKTLILRSSTICTLEGTNAFDSTPIASGTGYIYVPDNLVDTYKSATNWSTYANQIKPISELGE